MQTKITDAGRALLPDVSARDASPFIDSPELRDIFRAFRQAWSHAENQAAERMLRAYVAKSRAAPESAEPSAELLLNMAKWIARERMDFHKDHACGRCVPGGEIVKDGFTCVYHEACDILATSSAAKGAT